MLSRHLTAAVVLTALTAGGAAAAGPPSGAFALMEQVVAAYGQLDAYRDHGTLTVARGGAFSRFRFTTERSAGGDFLFALTAEAAEAPCCVVWRRGGESRHLDGRRGQFREVASPPVGLAALLPEAGLDALAVPLLLVGEDPLRDPDGASLGGPEACGGEAGEGCWILHLSRLNGALLSRLWVERDSLLVRRLEVERWPLGPGGGGQGVVYELEHHPEPVPEGFRVAYDPPPSARRVVSWEDPAPAAEPVLDFGETISVALLSLVVRVADSRGRPLEGLGVEDFRVTVRRDGERVPVPVDAVDWIASPGAAPERGEPVPGATPGEAGAGTGKWVVLFIQPGDAPVRIKGHLRLLPLVRDLIATFAPRDRIAVVSFDSQLKLYQDFTGDRTRVGEILWDAIRFGGDAPARRAGRRSAFGESFDEVAARQAATVPQALEVTARALVPLAGAKEIVYVGWGLGEYGGSGIRMGPGYRPALEALADARATVHVLDVTQADLHDLEAPLKQVAAATGGTYQKTYHFPDHATRKLARTLSGYYLLHLDRSRLAAGGDLEVELVGRDGRVIMRPLSVR